MLQAGSLRSPDEELRPSLLFLHDQHERADERGRQEHSHALQRPDVTSHQSFADSFYGERASVWREDRQ